jgi:replicative DNA helicase
MAVTTRTRSFDDDFAEEIVAEAMRSKDFMRTASRVLGARHFTTRELEWVFTVAKETWGIHRELATPSVFKIRADREFSKREDRDVRLALVVKLFRRTTTFSATALDELRRFLMAVEYSEAMKKSLSAYKAGDIDAAMVPMHEMIKGHVRPTSYEVVDWIEEFPERQRARKHAREHPEEHIVIPTGLDKLDRVIGGVGPCEFGLVMGTTGKGKSIFLTHLGFQAISHGFRTLHLSLEMGSGLVATRYDARWTGYLHRQLKRWDLSAEDEERLMKRFERDKHRFRRRLRIVSMPVRSCDITVVRGAVEEFKREYGGIDLLLIDSPDHMKSLSGFREMRHQQADVYWEVKDLLDSEKIPGWGSCHAGKQAARGTATAEDAAESYDKSRIADIVLTINNPSVRRRAVEVEGEIEGEESTTAVGDLELFLAKNRDGEGRVRVPLNTEFARMLIREAKELEELAEEAA